MNQYWSKRIGKKHLGITHPELAKEWSPKNKRPYTSVNAKSQQKALWICQNCHGEYLGVIARRADGTKSCPYCLNRSLLSGYNDLLTVDPALALEWSPNNALTPDKVRRTLTSSAYWICPVCHGEYSAQIHKRHVGDTSCPYCSNRKRLAGSNTFKAIHPDLMAEWSIPENLISGVDPDKEFPSSRKLVWWICNECRRKYLFSIAIRILNKERGINPCPHCQGRRQKFSYSINNPMD